MRLAPSLAFPPMSPGRPRAALALAMLAAAFAAGCGGDDEGGDGASTAGTTSTGVTTAQAQDSRTLEKQAEDRKKQDAKKKKAAKEDLKQEQEAAKKEAARDRAEDRKFDEAFEETPVEKVLSGLPLRKSPLYVQQYLTTEGSHKVYTAVDPKRFCAATQARRKAAVTTFYRSADKRFRAAGIDDFAQVVTPVSQSTDKLPALATAGKGTVRLTARGRSKSC